VSSHAPDAILRRLEWTVVRRLDGILQGDYRTLFRGNGIDLAGLREYQDGDDVRHIDWNVTARLQALHVREYQQDRELTAWFLLDLSSSMDFASDAVSKRTVLTEFVAVMARLLTGKGNSCGAMLFSDVIDRIVPARSGRRHVLHLLDLASARPHLVRPGATDLKAVLHGAAAMLKRRSMVFVVSDFISSTDWAPALERLARRHDVVAVRLVDPLEGRMPDLGLLTFQDAETGEQILVDTGSRRFRRRFADAAQQAEASLRASFGRAGVDCLELSTEDDLLDAFRRFTHMRRQRLTRSAA
jgi:uncharacterized protein (DUF58 family)